MYVKHYTFITMRVSQIYRINNTEEKVIIRAVTIIGHQSKTVSTYLRRHTRHGTY